MKTYKFLLSFMILVFVMSMAQTRALAESGSDSSALTGGILLPSEKEELAKESLEIRKNRFTVTDSKDLIPKIRPITMEETVLLSRAAKILRGRKLHEDAQELERVMGKLANM